MGRACYHRVDCGGICRQGRPSVGERKSAYGFAQAARDTHTSALIGLTQLCGAVDEIYTPARTPQRRRCRRDRVLADLQYSPDERCQLPQLQEWWPAHLSRRRIRYLPGEDHRTQQRLLEYHHRYSESQGHQRDAQADAQAFDQDRAQVHFAPELSARALLGAGVLRAVVAQAVLVLAAALGFIHRQIGDVNQPVHARRVVREYSDTQAGTDALWAVGEIERGGWRREDLLADSAGFLLQAAVQGQTFEDDHEFIAADACHAVGFA